jgi:hypothetical protein
VLELDQALDTPLPCGAMLDVSLLSHTGVLINLVHDCPESVGCGRWHIDVAAPSQGCCLLIAGKRTGAALSLDQNSIADSAMLSLHSIRQSGASVTCIAG